MGICRVGEVSDFFFIKTSEKQGLFVAARGATCLFFQRTEGELKKQTGGAPSGHKQSLLFTSFDKKIWKRATRQIPIKTSCAYYFVALHWVDLKCEKSGYITKKLELTTLSRLLHQRSLHFFKPLKKNQALLVPGCGDILTPLESGFIPFCNLPPTSFF